MKRNVDLKKLDELWEKADELLHDGHEEKAFRTLLCLAKQGHVDSQNSVGYLLDHGGAKNGDTIAAINIGLTYLSRDNIPLAKSWFNRALQQGDKQAAYYLGKIYSKSPIKAGGFQDAMCGTKHYSYDAPFRLTDAGNEHFTYDATGNLVKTGHDGIQGRATGDRLEVLMLLGQEPVQYGYNVASVQIRIGYETKKGDRLEQFTNVFDRYLHTSPIPPSKRNIETNQYWRGFQCFV